MTLESILYLLFGFLIAVFLALILVPAVWNRAVYLTEKKVKSSLPFNTREIEAEKDALRAEHALTVRRLELAIGELREKASTHIADLHGMRDENNRLKSSASVAKESLASLEKAAEEMRGKIADLHEENTEREEKLQSALKKVEKLNTDHDDLQKRYSFASEELNRARVDLIAKDGKIDSLAATLETLNLPEDGKAGKVRSLSDDITDLKKQLAEEQKLSRKLQKSNDALEKQLSKASNEIESSEKSTSEELATVKREMESRILDLGEELMQEKTRSIELEAELARRALAADIDKPHGDNGVGKTMLTDELKAAGEELSEDIRALAGKKPTAAQKKKLQAKVREIGNQVTSASG